MELINIKRGTNYLESAISLYESAFPSDERRDTDKWLSLIKTSPIFSVFVILEEKTFVGFISLWQLTGFLYVEHFAVVNNRRGMGFGGKTIQMVLDNSEFPIILEVEPPTTPMSIKRIDFYRLHGLSIVDKEYIQPPYSPDKSEVALYLMSNVKNTHKYSLKAISSEIHANVYGVDNQDVNHLL